MAVLSLKKRGQGVYMLIGAVLLMIFVFGFYVYSSGQKEKSEESKEKVIEESVLPSLKLYIKQSMDEASIDVIKEIGPHGGTLDPDPSFWKAIEIAYTCYKQNPGSPNACVNTFITRSDIEEELANEILENLNDIIDLTQFRNQGIDIEEGSRSVRVILGKTALVIELNYPLTLTVKNNVEKIETFQSSVNLPLGILYDLSKLITNTETQEKEFNISEWYQKHPDLPIIIDVELTSDGKLYQTSMDDYIFNFALSKTDLQPAEHGCCYDRYDMSCYKNVPEDQCNEMEGEYDPNPLCYCPTEGRLSCVVSLPDAGCTDPYTEVLKMSDYENAHASMPGMGYFRNSLCCNILAFYITQEPDIIGTDCSEAVFAKLSYQESGHVDDPGHTDSFFNEKACISSQKNKITCRVRDGLCLGEEEPILSLMSHTNSHVGYAYKYNTKICCEAEEI
ncbi:hypothetical protein ACFL6I_16965 [candidate division KSB1 bacterium]